MSGDERISIYTLSGNLVTSTTLTGGASWTWNGKNSSGAWVTRGIYIYFIGGSGVKKIGKIAIID
ncbi:hypothetical protein A2526_02445 [candidate division WOR-1 bacterium RIFOXYD2_FULL_36_8]|nr:MAG: hypothetical protein A2526_02445 [candidate division WOR-1 bacterium RIFOXYD2_FULL_36_8]